MNFNEKLIELRKKEGLSQEELGYKLNVTRQTISKWELGQTTPDMDKLSEISNFFGISVDNLLNEEVVEIEDKKINKENEQKNKKIVLIVLATLLILIIIAVIIYGSIINSFKGIFKGMFNIGKGTQENVIDKITSVVEEQLDEVKNNSSELKNEIDEQMQGVTESDNYERKRFNIILESYVGTNYGSTVSTAIDKIVTNNKKYKEQAIIVTYQGEKTAEASEIQKLKSKLDKLTEYEISYEYDNNGYIYQMDILNID